MNTSIAHKTSIKDKDNHIILIDNIKQLKNFSLSKEEMEFAQKSLDTAQKSISINQYNRWVFVQMLTDCRENARKAANSLHATVVGNKINEVSVINAMNNKAVAFAFAEGLALSNYQFLKYFSDKKKHSLMTINLCAKMSNEDANELQAIIDGTFIAKDLVNEPLSYLSALQYSKDIEKYGEIYGFSVTVLHKKQIESLKMGGLLAVNKGSIDPPTFSIMEWKPKMLLTATLLF